jgi:hypothetical protein
MPLEGADIDDRVDAAEDAIETLAAHHVDAARPRNDDQVAAGASQRLDGVPSRIPVPPTTAVRIDSPAIGVRRRTRCVPDRP